MLYPFSVSVHNVQVLYCLPVLPRGAGMLQTSLSHVSSPYASQASK